jgi:hypothetical protein
MVDKIQSIFFIQQVAVIYYRFSNEPSGGTDLVLRLGNICPWWKSIKTRNEVEVINFIKENCSNIPVPKVLKYQDDSALSEFDCEYILMEKLLGQPLSDIVRSVKGK